MIMHHKRYEAYLIPEAPNKYGMCRICQIASAGQGDCMPILITAAYLGIASIESGHMAGINLPVDGGAVAV